MQYRLVLSNPTPPLHAIQTTLLDADPSAIADIDLVTRELRLSTMLDEDALFRVIGPLDHGLRRDQVQRLPSECCGGCGG